MNDSFGVCYLLIGRKHAPLLAVSIHSLRNHYAGPVAILAGDEDAQRYAQLIADDPRAGDVRVVKWQFQGGQRGSVYFAKCKMLDLSPFERSVFLDADTIVQGDFSGLCPDGATVKLTQFSNWRTDGRRIRGRVMGWRDTAPMLVARAVGSSFPAINTGVMAFTKDAKPFFQAWGELCSRNIGFICDELSCQLCYLDFPHQVLDDRFNWCPVHSRTPVEQAVIVHLHGGANKPYEKPQYRSHWFSALDATTAENFAGISDWGPSVDEHLAKRLKGR
jgi:hypothetical protein